MPLTCSCMSSATPRNAEPRGPPSCLLRRACRRGPSVAFASSAPPSRRRRSCPVRRRRRPGRLGHASARPTWLERRASGRGRPASRVRARPPARSFFSKADRHRVGDPNRPRILGTQAACNEQRRRSTAPAARSAPSNAHERPAGRAAAVRRSRAGAGGRAGCRGPRSVGEGHEALELGGAESPRVPVEGTDPGPGLALDGGRRRHGEALSRKLQ